MTPLQTWIRRGSLAALLVACVLVQSGEGAAQGQVVLKIATPHHPLSPWGRALDRFVQHVHDATRQRIRVRVFYEGILGPDADQVARVIEGSLQGYAGPIEGLAAHVPALRAMEAPYLFRSREDAAKKLTRAHDRIDTVLGENGLRLGQWQHGGFRARFVTREGQTEMSTITDALTHGLDRRTASIALTRHTLAAGALVYSQRWFDGLPAQTQSLLTRLPDELGLTLDREVAALETDLLDGLKARGIAVTDATSEPRANEQRQAIDAYLQPLNPMGRSLYRDLAAP